MEKTRKIIVITLLVILPFVMIGTDYCLAKANKSPIFAIRTAIYKDGGTKDYVGLGYKIRKYNKLDGRKDTVFIPFFASDKETE